MTQVCFIIPSRFNTIISTHVDVTLSAFIQRCFWSGRSSLRFDRSMKPIRDSSLRWFIFFCWRTILSAPASPEIRAWLFSMEVRFGKSMNLFFNSCRSVQVIAQRRRWGFLPSNHIYHKGWISLNNRCKFVMEKKRDGRSHQWQANEWRYWWKLEHESTLGIN